jgi:hypothetical protein
MRKRKLPQPFQVEEINFRICFSAPSLQCFLVLMTGWVLTVGTHTLSQVILTTGLHESMHFASVYRFFSRASWDPDHVGQQIFRMMLRVFKMGLSEIVCVLDDTMNSHRGPAICGAGWQYDGSKPKGSGKTGYGVCFVIIGLAVSLPGISDRVFCLPFAARLWWPPNAEVKPETIPYRTKPEIGLELVKLTHSWLEEGQTLRVVGDKAYTCETIIKGRPKGVHITGKLRTDACLYGVAVSPPKKQRGRPRQKGHRLPTPEMMFRNPKLPWEAVCVTTYGKDRVMLVHQFQAIWYHSAGNEVLTFVLCRDPLGEQPDTVFFDTDLQATDKEIIVRFAKRWGMEITNRETKQILGSADPQCRKEAAVARTPMMAYWAYSLVVMWFVGQYEQAKNLLTPCAPWYRRKTNITFSDMIAAARRTHIAPVFLTEARSHKRSHKIQSARSPREPPNTIRAKV